MMPSVTCYGVLPFVQGRDGSLMAIEAEGVSSKNMARFHAAAIVGRKARADTIVGAIAFAQTSGPDDEGTDDRVGYGMTARDIADVLE